MTDQLLIRAATLPDPLEDEKIIATDVSYHDYLERFQGQPD